MHAKCARGWLVCHACGEVRTFIRKNIRTPPDLCPRMEELLHRARLPGPSGGVQRLGAVLAPGVDLRPRNCSMHSAPPLVLCVSTGLPPCLC